MIVMKIKCNMCKNFDILTAPRKQTSINHKKHIALTVS